VAAGVYLALKGLTACGELPELAHRGLKGVPERIVFQERKQTLDKGRAGRVHLSIVQEPGQGDDPFPGS